MEILRWSCRLSLISNNIGIGMETIVRFAATVGVRRIQRCS
jgi:hypothetical protein